MEQVELALDRLAVGARRKGCDLALVVDGDEVVVEQALDVALLADLLERGRVLGDAEHGCGEGMTTRVSSSVAREELGAEEGPGAEEGRERDALGVPVAKTGLTWSRTPSLRHCDSACRSGESPSQPRARRRV